MELPWSATLPISPALRSQWQSLLDKNDVIGAVNLFPTIWNSLRVSCSWIVNNQLPKKNKGLIKYEAYYMTHQKFSVDRSSSPVSRHCWHGESSSTSAVFCIFITCFQIKRAQKTEFKNFGFVRISWSVRIIRQSREKLYWVD